MATPRSKFGKREELALAALLSEPTHEKAAERAGISPMTLSRWLRRPDFQAAFKAARRAVLDTTVARLQQASGLAVQALVDALGCEHLPSRVRAAQLILDHGWKGLELLDLNARIAALERGPEQPQPDRTAGMTEADLGRELEAVQEALAEARASEKEAREAQDDAE